MPHIARGLMLTALALLLAIPAGPADPFPTTGVSGGVAGFTIPQAIVVTVQLSGLLANGLSLWFVGLVVVPIIVRLVLLAMRPPMRPACAR